MQSNRPTEQALELVLGSIAALAEFKGRTAAPIGDIIANLGTAGGILAELDADARREDAEMDCSWCGGPCTANGPIYPPRDVSDRRYDAHTTLPSGVSERTVGWIRPE